MTILLDLNFACSWPLILAALGSALLGWLLHQFLKGGNSSELQTKYDKLSTDFNEEREKNNKLHAQLKKKGNNASVMGASSSNTNDDEVNRLKSKLEAMKAEVKVAADAKIAMQAEVTNANTKAKEANAMSNEIEGLKGRIESLNRALEEARTSSDKYKLDFDSANGERARLSQQLTSSDVGQLQKTIDKLESDLNISRISAGQLQTELDKLKFGDRKIFVEGEIKPLDHTSTIKGLEEEIKALKAEQNALKLENERWGKEIANKNLEMVAVRNDAMMKSNAEIIELRNKLKLADLDNQRLNESAQKQANVLMNTTTQNVVIPEPAPTKKEVPQPMAVAPEPIAEEPAPEVVTPHTDDLTVVEGIGPKIAILLNDAGIINYTQLADKTPESIKEILEAAGNKLNNPSTWPEQAALLRDGKMDEFKVLCDELVAGVRLTPEEIEARKNKQNSEDAIIVAAKANPDDLTVLEGVGPVLAKILNEGNIYTYAQLADTQVDALKEILEAAGDKMHNPGSWPKQAELLRDGKMDEFKAYCDELNAGRM